MRTIKIDATQNMQTETRAKIEETYQKMKNRGLNKIDAMDATFKLLTDGTKAIQKFDKLEKDEYQTEDSMLYVAPNCDPIEILQHLVESFEVGELK